MITMMMMLAICKPIVSVPFDYFILSLQWPAGVCVFSKCQNTPPSFTIHGLWPANFTGQVEKCNVAYTEITDPVLLQDLVIYWPDLTEKPPVTGMQYSQGFWEHEWDRHGSCSNYPHQNDYFQRTIIMSRSLDLLGILAHGRITPGNQYDYQDFLSNLTHGIGVQPYLACQPKRKVGPVLQEVRVCYDNAAAHPINCPLTTKSCLPDPKKPSIQFPK